MIRINLLPYRAARKKENIRFQVNVFLGSIVFVGLLIFWSNSMLNSHINDLHTNIKKTKDEVAKYQQINKEIAGIRRNLSVLEKKIKVINSLDSDRKAPVEMMDSLYKLLVEKRMWYTHLEERHDRIKVDGVALDNQTVADYMTRIEKSKRFDNVQLAAVKKFKMRGKKEVNLKKFEVNFQNKPSSKSTSEVKK